MIDILHSYNQFHAAGHGTFFSGEIGIDKRKINTFLWVYDCGSKRSGRMDALAQDLHNHCGKDQIDLLCVSHFDADHVNGLKGLLARFFVDTLALPYLPLARRLEIASTLDEDQDGSSEAMLFCLDPGGFISLRGLNEHVGRIVLIQGGNESAPPPPEGLGPQSDAPQRDDNQNVRMELSLQNFREDENYATGAIVDLSGNRAPSMHLMRHTSPARLAGGLWELVFFNKDLPSGLAPESGATLENLQTEIREILEAYDLNKGDPKVVEGWRKTLRKCYDKHFGTSSLRRNDISLCVLSRPTHCTSVEGCQLFIFPSSVLDCAHVVVPAPPDTEYTGLLLTGDISLDPSTVKQIQNHVGLLRWTGIYVMQVPHHGSINSWQPGISGFCPHRHSIFCVPDADKNGHHPNDDVVADLSDHGPLFANYSSSVVYAFHVKT